MKVEIWSDVVCPFCYIGKRRFEQALENFEGKEVVEIIWKSYQLDPDAQNEPGLSIHDYLAQRKGLATEQAKELNDHVTNMATEVGLHYDFSKAVVANTFDAHRLSHLAAQKGLQGPIEERLFSAYFSEGQNIQDKQTLVELGVEIGLDAGEVATTLDGTNFADDVKKDIYEAQQIGVRGVPFFVFNNKYAISGAQAAETFLQVLEKAYGEEKPLTIIDGNACDLEGDC